MKHLGEDWMGWTSNQDGSYSLSSTNRSYIKKLIKYLKGVMTSVSSFIYSVTFSITTAAFKPLMVKKK